MSHLLHTPKALTKRCLRGHRAQDTVTGLGLAGERVTMFILKVPKVCLHTRLCKESHPNRSERTAKNTETLHYLSMTKLISTVKVLTQMVSTDCINTVGIVLTACFLTCPIIYT